MAKYHLNPETGKPGVCKAEKQCRFGANVEHFNTRDDARAAYESQQAGAVMPSGSTKAGKSKAARPPILLEPTPLDPPTSWYFSGVNVIEAATDADRVDYYSESWADPTYVNVYKALEEVTSVESSSWPLSLHRLVEDHPEWNEVDSWYFENGFYEGDSPTLTPPLGMEAALTEWYYSQPNAKDFQGILEHVREKGYDTTGLDPLAAVKKMLAEENDMLLKHVEQARMVSLHEHSFQHLGYAKEHYNRIEAKEPIPVSPRSKEIMGVLRMQNNNYRLIDGHHRMKDAKSRGRTSGTFIILY